MRFLDSTFPLIVAVHSMKIDDAEVREMIAGYERYFHQGERYAVLSVSPAGAVPPGPRERRLITQWADHPRVRDFSKRLCAGSATVVTSAVMRGAMSALLWLWKPAAPHSVVPSLERGLDYCFERLAAESVPLPRNAMTIRHEVQRALDGVL